MDIQKIMSTAVVSCKATDTLNTAARKMWEGDCGALPVLDQAGTVMGMITDRDICMAAYTKGIQLCEGRVSGAMSPTVVWCDPGASLDEVEQLMSTHRIRRLPVIDPDGQLVGLISLNDVARFAASSPKSNGVRRELAQTLAAISAPRHIVQRRID